MTSSRNDRTRSTAIDAPDWLDRLLRLAECARRLEGADQWHVYEGCKRELQRYVHPGHPNYDRMLSLIVERGGL